MPDISKLKIHDTVYTVKDSTARSGLSDAQKNDEIYSATQPATGTQNTGAFWTQIITS